MTDSLTKYAAVATIEASKVLKIHILLLPANVVAPCEDGENDDFIFVVVVVLLIRCENEECLRCQ